LKAVVLAPFFVHLEVLFMLGYRPDMHKQLKNDVGKEIARIRKIEGDKKRAAAVKTD
jgi:2-hydroxy fatty acid dioxygenase